MKEIQPSPGQLTLTNAYIPYLDGLRGLAILLVSAGHIFYEYYIFKIGWVGLNLFFILSGYLITQQLFQFKEHSTKNYFRNFYGRRILRIFPLYYGVLMLFLILLPFLFQSCRQNYAGLIEIQNSFWLYLSNWHFIINGLPSESIFFHFWSLAVEEQFYVVWPVLFLIFYSNRSKYILIAILMVASIMTRILTNDPVHAYLNTLTATEPLLLGCLLRIIQEEGLLKRVSTWLRYGTVISMLFLSYAIFENADLHVTNDLLIKYGYSAIDIIIGFGFCLLLIGSWSGLKMRVFFSMRWMRWLGKYSYAIYVFHWIVLQTVIFKLESVLVNNLTNQFVAYLVARAAGIAIILILSYCSYHFFEKHFLGLKKYFTEDSSWSSVWGKIFVSQKHKRRLAGN